MTQFSISPTWLEGADEEEGRTFAEIVLSIEGAEISGLFDPDRGESASGPRMPAALLATGITDHWWRLLYEPQKSERDLLFESRHRLDSFTRGYVFPPLAIWSGGEAVVLNLLRPDIRFQRQTFALPDHSAPWFLSRDEVEKSLGSFVEATLERISGANFDGSFLKDQWRRIVDSIHDPDERAWCSNAGRLGFDPYDPDTPDLERIADGLSDSVFSDVCEAADVNDLARTCQWVRGASQRLRNAPTIPIKAFGAAPRRELGHPGYRDGYGSAKLLRRRLGLSQDPTRSVGDLLGDALTNPLGQLDEGSPDTVDGLTRREGTDIRVGVAIRATRQRRFRMCRGAYLAWRSGPHGEAAITTAQTWRQQASRAFAAELLAPADLLKERTAKTGLTPLILERLASEWACPTQAIVHQAENHGVQLRGVSASFQ